MRNKSLFGTSGIRGHAEKLFTPQFCFDIGSTFVDFLAAKDVLGPIAVGMDPRTSSPRIKEQLFRGLSTSNFELFDEGGTPIPSMNWLIINTEITGAIMVTGSHIASELNGVKFYAHDEEISYEDQLDIEKIYRKLKGKTKYTKREIDVNEEQRAIELYTEMLVGLASNKLRKYKVALDCANGAQSFVIPQVLERIGLEVVKVNCNPHGGFIARDTDTDDKAQIEEIKRVVVDEKCDFGVAFDGDGDRSVFINEKGEFVQGEYSCSIIAKESKSDTIVTTIAASQVVDHIGKKIIKTKVGSPYVVGKMKENNSTFGFEQNGGAISAEIMYTRDGGSVMMKVINALSKTNFKFSEMISTLPKYHMARTKVDYKWELQETILKKAEEEFKGIKVEKIDGLKIWVDKSTWILFRSSQNAPEFRVFAESKSKSTSEKLLKDGVSFVERIIKNNG